MRTAIVGAAIVCCMTLLLALATLYQPTKPHDANEVLVTFASPISDASQAGDHSDLKVSYWPDEGGLSGRPKVEKVLDINDSDALVRALEDARRVHGKGMLLVVNAEPCRPWMYVAPILGGGCSAGLRDVRLEAGDRKVRIRLPGINGEWFTDPGTQMPASQAAASFEVKVMATDRPENFRMQGSADLVDDKGLAAALAQRKAAMGADKMAAIIAPEISASWKDVVEAVALATETEFEHVALSAR